MHVELPDQHPGRCRNLRYAGAECLRCLDYDDTPHICRFPEPPRPASSVNYTIQTTSLSPWVAPVGEIPMDAEPQWLEDPDYQDGNLSEPCLLPPRGWYCTLGNGHSGPCPTWPKRWRRTLSWLRSHVATW